MSRRDDNVPAISSSGEIMQHAGKYARAAVLTVFDQMGGTDAMTEWAKKNQTDFYTKLFPKIIDREPAQAGERGVEELLADLDREMIDVTPECAPPEVEVPAHRSPWPAAAEYAEEYEDE